MDKSFDKFLLDLEGEKNCIDLRHPASNGNHGEAQQRNFDLECLEKELGVMQQSLDDTYVDTTQIPHLYQRAQSVVKDLEATEHQLHENNNEIPSSAESITKAKKDVSKMAESFQEIVDCQPLDFNTNAIFMPWIEQANAMKNKTVQQVSEAANSFDIQTLVVEITRIAEQRKKRANLLLEKEACRSLFEDASNALEQQREEYDKFCVEKENLQMVLRNKKEIIGNWSNEAKRLQEQIDEYRIEVDTKQRLADQTILDHNAVLNALEAGASKYSAFSEQKIRVQSAIDELKGNLCQDTARYDEQKAKFLEKVVKSLELKQAMLKDLKQRQFESTTALKKAQEEWNNVNRIRERLARKEAGTNGLDDAITSTKEKIEAVKEAGRALNAKRECYKLESERKINGRKLELLELQKKIDEKELELHNLESKEGSVEVTLSEKTIECNNLKHEIDALTNPQTPPDCCIPQPVSTSTPLISTSNSSFDKTGKAPPKLKPARGRPAKRGGKKKK